MTTVHVLYSSRTDLIFSGRTFTTPPKFYVVQFAQLAIEKKFAKQLTTVPNFLLTPALAKHVYKRHTAQHPLVIVTAIRLVPSSNPSRYFPYISQDLEPQN